MTSFDQLVVAVLRRQEEMANGRRNTARSEGLQVRQRVRRRELEEAPDDRYPFVVRELAPRRLCL